MPNSQQNAQRWLSLVLEQHWPGRDLLAQHVAAGAISSLCECGCHGFGFEVPRGAQLRPLATGGGMFCELAFSSDGSEEIDVLLFTDALGNFAGADVTYGAANVEPMPDDLNATGLIGIWPSGKSRFDSAGFEPTGRA